jgi:hypothetical protein
MGAVIGAAVEPSASTPEALAKLFKALFQLS